MKKWQHGSHQNADMLAPSGNRIRLSFDSENPFIFENYETVLLNSGTAALASAITITKNIKNVKSPEVIAPAYTCPDIISACAFSGVKCRLCDIYADDPGYNLELLKNSINENTIAIIAINFLGIQERLIEISKLAKDHDLLLIEDDAQWYPELKNNETLTGDFICLSFGRGKPVSLLGGGALLIKDQLHDKNDLKFDVDKHHYNFGLIPKVIAYNTMVQPVFYQFTKYIPGLKLGETNYKELPSAHSLDSMRKNILKTNIKNYLLRDKKPQTLLTELLKEQGEIDSLPSRLNSRTRRLLRFPVLIKDGAKKSKILNDLMLQGLGASPLYGKPLNKIENTNQHIINDERFEGAENFSSKLITLPTHEFVKKSHIEKIGNILNI